MLKALTTDSYLEGFLAVKSRTRNEGDKSNICYHLSWSQGRRSFSPKACCHVSDPKRKAIFLSCVAISSKLRASLQGGKLTH